MYKARVTKKEEMIIVCVSRCLIPVPSMEGCMKAVMKHDGDESRRDTATCVLI